MILGELLGQEAALTLIERALVSGRLPHALLLHGPAGTGQRTAALRLAAALQCTAREERSPACGRCDPCRQIAHGNHPDVFVIEREPRRGASGAAPADEIEEPDDDETVDAPAARG